MLQPRIAFDEGARCLAILRNSGPFTFQECPRNRVRYTTDLLQALLFHMETFKYLETLKGTIAGDFYSSRSHSLRFCEFKASKLHSV